MIPSPSNVGGRGGSGGGGSTAEETGVGLKPIILWRRRRWRVVDAVMVVLYLYVQNLLTFWKSSTLIIDKKHYEHLQSRCNSQYGDLKIQADGGNGGRGGDGGQGSDNLI